MSVVAGVSGSGVIAGADGNVSVKLGPDECWSLRAGVLKSEAPRVSRGHDRIRFAPEGILPEIALLLGEVACVPYATAGTPALGNAAEPFLDRHMALLLANHGALIWGRDLSQARIRMETLEHGARILFAARALGGVNRLTRDQIDVLERMRGTLPMAKTTDTEATIESLLEQRSQYEEWLLRLDTSGDKASPAVRQRVRGDYQARLDQVMEQLRSRGATIAEELERQHASQAEIDRERRTAEEALAEAEVRHSVGEYDEGEWKRLVDQSKKEIEQLRSQLRSIGAEITRLTQIQALIAAPRSGGAPAAPAAAPSPRAARPEVMEQAPMFTHVGESFDEPAAPPPAPKRAQPEAPAPPGDELAFLKSVSDEEPSRMAGRQPSNPALTAPTATAPAKPPEPATTPKAGTGVAKTLKCGECGTLNRPTEWYCERCGAELAGV